LKRLAPAPEATPIVEFEPGEAAQVDFGRGPQIGGRGTWVFVMILAWSRHAYAELVWDQTMATWLGCHQRPSPSWAACRRGW
jgi:transposase